MSAPSREPRDWQSLFEQAQARAERERARADAAEARAEELLQAERAARSRAGSLKWRLDKSRDKLEAAVEEVKEVRRAAKDAPFFQAEVARLEKLLSQAGVDSSRRSTIVSLRMEVFRLREALQASEARKDTTAPPPGGNPRPLKAALAAGKDTTEPLSRENARLRKALERSQEQKDELVALRRKVAALRRSKRTAQASPPRASARLRKALERTRKQKDTIKGAARGSRFLEPGGPSAEPGERPAAPRAGAVGGPQGDSTPAVRRGQAAARGAGGIPQPDGPHRFAEEARRLSGNCPEEVRHREGGAGSPTRRASPAGRGRQEIARSGQDRRVAAQGERRAGQEDKGAAGSQRETGRPDCPAPFDPCRLVEGGLREQERTAGEARHGAQARPAARCARPPAAPSGPSSGRRRNGATRRRMRACVPVAASPMWRTASVPRPSPRSRSRPTSAGSSGHAGAGVATARLRLWR